jgi:hypothetical protein
VPVSASHALSQSNPTIPSPSKLIIAEIPSPLKPALFKPILFEPALSEPVLSEGVPSRPKSQQPASSKPAPASPVPSLLPHASPTLAITAQPEPSPIPTVASQPRSLST